MNSGVCPDCALGSRTRWSSSVTEAKWNQSAEDLVCDYYHGRDFKFLACRDPLEGHRKIPAKCFDVLLEKVEGDGDCP